MRIGIPELLRALFVLFLAYLPLKMTLIGNGMTIFAVLILSGLSAFVLFLAVMLLRFYRAQPRFYCFSVARSFLLSATVLCSAGILVPVAKLVWPA